MGLVIYDRQHAGQVAKVRDVGASADLDHDGVVEVSEQEAVLTARYSIAAETRSRELGDDVIVLSDGRYSERHARANAYAKAYAGPCAYVACHLNAGGGAYGLALHDHRSARGQALADAVAVEWRAALPELAAVHVRAAAPFGDWVHAYNTIAGVYEGRPVGLCAEPCFLDGPLAAGLLSSAGLDRIGHALALGVHKFFNGV
jgi:hypothetical protein